MNLLIEKYIGEQAKHIENALIKHDTNAIIAPTGTGKTSLLYSKDYGVPVYQVLNRKHGKKHILLVFLTTTLKQRKDVHDHKHITIFNAKNRITKTKILDILNYEANCNQKERVIGTNYSYGIQVVEMLIELSISFSIVFDETHTLYLKKYRNKELDKLSRIIKRHPPKSILHLSATMEKTFLQNANVINIERRKKPSIIASTHFIQKMNINSAILDFCNEFLFDHHKNEIADNNPLLFVFFNNTEELNKVKDQMAKISGNENSVLILTRNHKEEKYFEKITKTPSNGESFDSEVKIILTTSIAEDSIDFFTKRKITILHMVSNEIYLDVYGLKQFCGRFRNTMELTLKIVVSCRDFRESEERYRKELTPELIQGMYAKNFEFYRESENQKHKTLYSRRLKQARNIITNDMSDDDKQLIIELYTTDLNDDSNTMMTEWIAAQRTHEHMVDEMIGFKNLKSELIRQFGDSIQFDDNDKFYCSSKDDKISSFSLLAKQDLSLRISQSFSEQTISELRELVDSNWTKKFVKHENYIDYNTRRKQLKLSYPNYTEEELSEIIWTNSTQHKWWLNEITYESEKKLIVDFLDSYDLVQRLPMYTSMEFISEILFEQKYNREENDDGEIGWVKAEMIIRRKSDIRKLVNKHCIAHITRRFSKLEPDSQQYFKIYNQYPELPLAICDITVLSKWIKTISTGDKFSNVGEISQSTIPKGVRSLYKELDSLNLKIQTNSHHKRAKVLNWLVYTKRTTHKKHNVYVITDKCF